MQRKDVIFFCQFFVDRGINVFFVMCANGQLTLSYSALTRTIYAAFKLQNSISNLGMFDKVCNSVLISETCLQNNVLQTPSWSYLLMQNGNMWDNIRGANLTLGFGKDWQRWALTLAQNENVWDIVRDSSSPLLPLGADAASYTSPSSVEMWRGIYVFCSSCITIWSED